GPIHLLLVLTAAGPSQQAGEFAQPRIEQQVDHAKDHGDVEQPQPPARQGVVVFLQAFIPGMSGDVTGGGFTAAFPGGPDDQPPAESNIAEGEDDDPPTPEVTTEGNIITHDAAPY